MSGKTTFLKHLVKFRKSVFNVTFARIIFCHPADRNNDADFLNDIEEFRNSFSNLELFAGLPDVEMCRSGENCLVRLLDIYCSVCLKKIFSPQVLIDDLGAELVNRTDMPALFTQSSHHKNLSVVWCSNYFFPKTSLGRELPSQMSHHVLFSIPGELHTFKSISNRWTGKTNTLEHIMDWIEKQFPGKGNNYILADLHPDCADKSLLKLRTAIFPRPSPLGELEVLPVFFVINKPTTN